MNRLGRAVAVDLLLLPLFLAMTSPRVAAQSATPAAKSERSVFGKMPDGTEIVEYSLRNKNGVVVKLISYGATLRELHVPDRNGKSADIVLGFDDLKSYLGNHPHFCGIIGRYANRIAKGKFELDGKTYTLPINDPPNTLHGGTQGFDHRVWDSAPAGSNAVRFTYTSKDGEEGFPGAVKVTVTYTLTDKNELKIRYSAESDKDTVINLTSHGYFNLAGAGSGDVLKHVLMLNADEYTPTDATLIPTGELKSVQGTPLDFRKPTAIGEHIAEMKDLGGYDNNFVVRGKEGLRLAARVTEPSSGREMEVWTTEPGIQFYSAIHLDGTNIGKGGIAYQKYGALCLESQHFPDSPNHPSFPTTTLHPGKPFTSETVYKFSAH